VPASVFRSHSTPRGELAARGWQFDAYYFRTSDQRELDLVLLAAGQRVAVEVKLTATRGLPT
jgi:hypothetical protein